MKRTEIINQLIKRNGFKSYLEIGLSNPYFNFAHIDCELKESVDPYDSNFLEPDLPSDIDVDKFLTYRMTSDAFFDTIEEDKKYDFIFIDGLHEYKQVARDIVNGFKHLNKGGLIMVHDTVPKDVNETLDEHIKGTAWYGNVYKTAMQFERFIPEFYTIDMQADEVGLSILKYFEGCENIEFTPEDISFDYYLENLSKLRFKSVHEVLDLLDPLHEKIEGLKNLIKDTVTKYVIENNLKHIGPITIKID